MDSSVSRMGRLHGVKRSKTAFMLLLLPAIILALALALFVAPLTPKYISAIAVRNKSEVVGRETHVLDHHSAEQFITALQGTAQYELPDIEEAYELTVKLKGLFPRRYEVYLASNRDVFLRLPLSGRLIRSDNPSFFYSHNAFNDLYIHGQMPNVRILAKEEDITPVVQERAWQYLKWDDVWYEEQLLPLPEASEEWPVFRSVDTPFTVVSDPAPDIISLQIKNPAGRIVFDDILVHGEVPVFAYNGLYTYQLRLSWDHEVYRGHYDASFSAVVDLPTTFILPGPTIYQGEMAAFYVHHVPDGATPVLETNLVPRVQFFPHEDGYVAYLPTHYGAIPGDYLLTYGLAGEALVESTVTVVPRVFHVQYMRIDPAISAATRNVAAYEQWSRHFPQSRETSAPHRYYDQPFMLPVSGRLTTEFGQTRYVNNSPTGSRHSGLDIAAPTGTPIVATNRGRVTLAMDLILTGNTLVIDHGQGLFSVHFHMHELYVEPGQLVERGETVGTVGSTGFSTGPHLHFTMSYFSHNLEPGFFLVGEPITFANAGSHLR